MKHLLLLLIGIIVIALPTNAQTPQKHSGKHMQEYERRRKSAWHKYNEDYRKAVAEYMRKRWEAYELEGTMELPLRNEPISPVVKQPQEQSVAATPSNEKIPAIEVVDIELSEPTPEPMPMPEPEPEPEPTPEPEPKPELSTKVMPSAAKGMHFSFYGTDCQLSIASAPIVSLPSVMEAEVANAWERIASGAFNILVQDCRRIKEELGLNDWGYLLLTHSLAETLYGSNSNEAVVLQLFLLSENGIKTRLARGDNKLWLLYAADTKIYAKPYFTIGGDIFYLFDDGNKASSFNICNFEVPGERALSMLMPNLPLLNYRAAEPHLCVSAKTTNVTITPNSNVIDFLNDFPQCDWPIYAATGLSEKSCVELLPPLREIIANKSNVEAAGTLLKFIHEAFPYKTDPQQFGRERTLFAEEMFAYPFSDCEDRSILYALLVRELLGLDVVLLHYPNHIATAVNFETPVEGDYVELDGARYTVCDATYIGADVGETMPEFSGMAAKIIRLN